MTWSAHELGAALRGAEAYFPEIALHAMPDAVWLLRDRIEADLLPHIDRERVAAFCYIYAFAKEYGWQEIIPATIEAIRRETASRVVLAVREAARLVEWTSGELGEPEAGESLRNRLRNTLDWEEARHVFRVSGDWFRDVLRIHHRSIDGNKLLRILDLLAEPEPENLREVLRLAEQLGWPEAPVLLKRCERREVEPCRSEGTPSEDVGIEETWEGEDA